MRVVRNNISGRLFDHRKRRNHRADRHAGQQLQLVDHEHVLERGRRPLPACRRDSHRHQRVVAAELLRQHVGQLRVHLVGRHVEQRQHEVVGIDLGDVLVQDQPHFHQQTLQGAVVLGPPRQGSTCSGVSISFSNRSWIQQRLRIRADFAGGCHGDYFSGFCGSFPRAGLAVTFT